MREAKNSSLGPSHNEHRARIPRTTPGTDEREFYVLRWSEITASGDFFLEVRARVVNVILGALGSYVNSVISGDLGSGSYPDRQGGSVPTR